MGTNYYYRLNICGHCGRHDEMHVSKGQYTWQAYPENSPFEFPIVSLLDWERVFEIIPGELWDEYGQRVSDPLLWLYEARPPDDEARKRKLEWWDVSRDSWDPQGYHFASGEWS